MQVGLALFSGQLQNLPAYFIFAEILSTSLITAPLWCTQFINGDWRTSINKSSLRCGLNEMFDGSGLAGAHLRAHGKLSASASVKDWY